MPVRSPVTTLPRGDFQPSLRQSGFTVVELMVALAVLAILLGLAAPAAHSMLRDVRLSNATNDLLGAFFFARSEAIKRGRRVTICTSGNGIVCEDDVGWHSGWVVFEDRDGNGGRSSGEPLLRVGGGDTSPQVRIMGNGSVRDYISYLPTGTTRMINGALQMGTITACEGGAGREIVVNSAGRPRVARVSRC